jgi:hypothetical protein
MWNIPKWTFLQLPVAISLDLFLFFFFSTWISFLSSSDHVCLPYELSHSSFFISFHFLSFMRPPGKRYFFLSSEASDSGADLVRLLYIHTGYNLFCASGLERALSCYITISLINLACRSRDRRDMAFKSGHRSP